MSGVCPFLTPWAILGWRFLRHSSFPKKNSSEVFEELSLIWGIYKYFLFAWLVISPKFGCIRNRAKSPVVVLEICKALK